MHPSVCRFISESIYEGRLNSHLDCARQKIVVPAGAKGIITAECGIVFSSVEHNGNIQRSDEEIERVKSIYGELRGRPYTAKDGTTRPLALEDFLFIAPYDAQVRALQAALPTGARVGSGTNSKDNKPRFASCPSVPATANTARAGLRSSSTGIESTWPSPVPNVWPWLLPTRASP